MGSYIFTNVNPDIHVSHSFEVPVRPGVQLNDLLTINLSGPGGTNFVTIDDHLTTAGHIPLTHTITASSYTRTGAAPIKLSDVFSFGLSAGSAVDTINVQSNPAIAGFNVQGGLGNDIINVGTAANQLAGIGTERGGEKVEGVRLFHRDHRTRPARGCPRARGAAPARQVVQSRAVER